MIMNSILVKDENDNVILKPMLSETRSVQTLEKEGELRRRDKKFSSKEAEFEESKKKLRDAMQEYHKLGSI